MTRIMLVDDEENIVRALSRSLRSTGWEIVTYTNAHEALLDIEKREFAAIVSDYRMPAINSVEFLEFCKLRQPETVRIILSAYADKDAMLQAVNTAQIFRFITKPWDDKELVMVLKQAIEQFELIKETRRLRKIVKEQRTALQELERQHPGLVAVQRDENNAIVLEEGMDI